MSLPAILLSQNSTNTIPHKTQTTVPFIIRKCIALIQSCASSPRKLQQIHAFSLRHGALCTDLLLAKHLIFAAVTLTLPMSYSHNIFFRVPSHNVFTWNTMIRGYAETDDPDPAVEYYVRMHRNSVCPDTHTYPFLLKAVAKMTNVRIGEKVHCVTVKNGFDSLVFVQNALVHMYATCVEPENARKLFELVPQKEVVTWNSVINGFALNGRPNEALALFREMEAEGVEPDGFTMVSLLSACAELGALAAGRRLHVYIIKVGFTENLHVVNVLLDLYAKCGIIREAKRVFDEMEVRNVVSWTSLIVGLAVNGFGKEALDLFLGLEREGLRPTEITFVGVLYACSHCGMVDKGFEYFKQMKEQYGIVPKVEHYGCMVDLLGRAGLLKNAYEYIQNMPMKANAVIWRTLLGACTMHKNMSLGEVARTRLHELEPKHCGDYVLLSNLYASGRRWTDVQNIRKKMLSEGVRKVPGYSLVELGNQFYEFIRGDTSHLQSKEIYELLEEMTKLLKLKGYVPHTENVFADIEDEEKENALSYHSEKIAVAFMLINTPPKTPIRVVKNLRVCGDCHLAIKLISKLYDREIVVRDRSRFHHFKDGSCSCQDYW